MACRVRPVRIATTLALIVAALSISSCFARSAADPPWPEVTCEFVVYNRTAHALEVRMTVRAWGSVPIGAINPGEMLTHATPCARHTVWITGTAIPAQVGSPTGFRFVYGQVELIEGERVSVTLSWPPET